MSRRGMFLRNRLSREARNTYIGGVAGTINTPELLADRLLANGGGSSEPFNPIYIKNFEIDGDDISCFISKSYSFKVGGDAFRGKPITYYLDLDNKQVVDNIAHQAFRDTSDLKVYITGSGNAWVSFFFNSGIELCVMTNPSVISASASTIEFNGCNNLHTAYFNPITATNNGGQPDAAITYIENTLGGTVKYNSNQSSAQAITDLSVDSTTASSVSLTWSEPINTNGIDYYLVFRDNVFLGYTDSLTYEVIGLTEETEYNFRVISLDSMGNTSEFSNVVVGETLVSVSAKTQAVLDRAILEGFTLPSNTKISALDTFINTLDTNGVLAKNDVLYNLGYNDLTLSGFARINIANPTAALLDVYGGMTYTTNGYEGNGVDGYLDLQFNPDTDGVNYLLDDAGRGVGVYKVQSSGLGELLGIAASSAFQTLYNTNQSAQRINASAKVLDSAADLSGLGLKTQYRDDNLNVRLYNKTTEIVRILASDPFFYNNGMVSNRRAAIYSDVGINLVFFSSSLTSTENETIRTSHNTYLSSIGLTPIS